MERRDFMQVCAASALGLGAPPSFADVQPRHYTRSRLTGESGQVLRTSHLATGENYVFHYPFEGTPCFLINLGKSSLQNVPLKTGNGASYRWPGGIGPQHAIVACLFGNLLASTGLSNTADQLHQLSRPVGGVKNQQTGHDSLLFGTQRTRSRRRRAGHGRPGAATAVRDPARI